MKRNYNKYLILGVLGLLSISVFGKILLSSTSDDLVFTKVTWPTTFCVGTSQAISFKISENSANNGDPAKTKFQNGDFIVVSFPKNTEIAANPAVSVLADPFFSLNKLL